MLNLSTRLPFAALDAPLIVFRGRHDLRCRQ